MSVAPKSPGRIGVGRRRGFGGLGGPAAALPVTGPVDVLVQGVTGFLDDTATWREIEEWG